MVSAQAARLAAVFIALVIVLGSAGYGITRAIQESDENAACQRYLQENHDELRRAQEEGYNIIQREVTQYDAVGVAFVQTDSPCTCEELADWLPSLDSYCAQDR